jgi:uncharacterized protein YutE (UPF0331/DUF86 family)
MPDKADTGIDEELITAKLTRIRQYLGFLEELQKASLDEFKGDFRLRGSAERYLQLAIEGVIDIGNEIISSLQLKRPERYRDVPYILSEAGILPKGFADSIASMIGLRNLLVHDYASTDLDLVYGFLQTRLIDFESFMRYIAAWLEKIKGVKG